MPDGMHHRVLEAYRRLELQFPDLVKLHGRAKLRRLAEIVKDANDLHAALNAIPDEEVRTLIENDLVKRLSFTL